MSGGEYQVFCLSMISWLVAFAVTGLAVSYAAAYTLRAIEAPTAGYVFVYQVLVVVVSAGISILALGPIYEFWKHFLLD